MSGKVPPSSRSIARGASRRVIPRSGGKREQIARAADLFERFTGMDAEEIGSVNVPEIPPVGVAVGTLDGVLYTTVRDGVTEKYIHKFKAKDRPLLVVSPDGKSMFIVGGRYDFTERGIVDASDTKTRRQMGIT